MPKKKTAKNVSVNVYSSSGLKFLTIIGKAALFIAGVVIGFMALGTFAFLSCHSSGGFCASNYDYDLAFQALFLTLISSLLISSSITNNSKRIAITVTVCISIAILTILSTRLF